MSGPPTIAVVDDDADVREALAGLIASLGLRCRLFESAEAFLERGESAAIDCMILDMKMPGLSGLELQERLNRQGHPPPILFLTSYSDEQTRRRALDRGAQGFLGKPVDDRELIRHLAEAIGGAALS